MSIKKHLIIILYMKYCNRKSSPISDAKNHIEFRNNIKFINIEKEPLS